jgi:hypothetical protein
MMPRSASGFYRRVFCRIFPHHDVWMLRVERGGWAHSVGKEDQKTFSTLSAAIAHAVRNGFSYRVVHLSDPAASLCPMSGYAPNRTAQRGENFQGGVDGENALS